ncbi:MAG: hypothetical protein A2751_02585 [Candidatus Doudnabacteria bacterium RIFCSPHIGHO2_01_FULL_46_14]|uniref:N-acetylmuramoyl-L-alanine amidase domain-containing protein n=1 Tax=Candidatus Doudnabacteria bacterium RIFCSPHIGHO2_01_FULL_46_14 TaxID=1817824 RepID=A0A1F5NJW7_9BACT|nr:MAG: hypothetical protein A2751_02585 [Candidatus Doudnabacteria bacterium RIFCSPHIGHO2_01_FULL_46_14]
MTPHFLIVHHSFTPKDLPANQAENSFNNTHKNRGFPVSSMGWYVGYHYVIYGNGELRQYRGDKEIGAHCKEQSMNFQSLGICLSGNFDTEIPNPLQTETLRTLLQQKSAEWGIASANIYPHRKFAPYKSCYGTKLADDWARNLIVSVNPINQGENRAVIIKKQGEPALYILEGNVALPFGVDFTTYQQDFGGATVVELASFEFAKLKISVMKIVKA